MAPPRIAITAGEPAGIGPDIVLMVAQRQWDAELIVIADPELLYQRAQLLGLPIELEQLDAASPTLSAISLLDIRALFRNRPSIL